MKFTQVFLAWMCWGAFFSNDFSVINAQTVMTTQDGYDVNTPIEVAFSGDGNLYDWVGLYAADDATVSGGLNLIDWLYVSGSYTPEEGITEGTVTFVNGLPDVGNYKVHFFANNNYTSLASYDFAVGCTPPINIDVEMTDANNALFSWDALSSATLYQVKYRLKGTTAWNTTGTSGTQRNIPNLTAKKYYQYKMRTQCSDGTWSDFSDIGLFYTSTCDMPTGIASVYLDNTRMRIRWDVNPDEIKAKVRYRELYTDTWHTKNSQNGKNYIYINNLIQNAIYEYRVRSNCNGNDWSEYSEIYYHELAVLEPNSREQEEQVPISPAVTKIYPNPTKDLFHIEFENKTEEEVSITISNHIGQVVHNLRQTYKEGIQRESIDMSPFANGYYFVTIQTGDEKETLKLVKVE